MSLKEQIQELRDSGLTYDDIVKQLNCSKGTVSYHLSAKSKIDTLDRQRDRRNKNRRYIIEYKKSSLCADCGLDYPYWILEFDHLGEELKVANISSMVNDYTLEQVKSEIAKCDVVCANCHKHRTWMRLVKEGESGR